MAEATYPEKQPGRHRWCVVAAFPVTDEEAAEVNRTGTAEMAMDRVATTHLGCVDCETTYDEAEGTCPAEAAVELAEVTGTHDGRHLPPDVKDRITAAADAIGRTGATGLDLGHVDGEDTTTWYASATYRDNVVKAEGHVGPVEAAEALLAQLLNGGHCTRCQRVMAIYGYMPAEHTPGLPPTWCVWRRIGPIWVPGCVDGTELLPYAMERGTRLDIEDLLRLSAARMAPEVEPLSPEAEEWVRRNVGDGE